MEKTLNSQTLEKLAAAIADLGGMQSVADIFGIKWQAVQKWRISGLPRTEFTGETNYALEMEKRAKKTGKKVSAAELLEETKKSRTEAAA
jgi:hypothetical protein